MQTLIRLGSQTDDVAIPGSARRRRRTEERYDGDDPKDEGPAGNDGALQARGLRAVKNGRRQRERDRRWDGFPEESGLTISG